MDVSKCSAEPTFHSKPDLHSKCVLAQGKSKCLKLISKPHPLYPIVECQACFHPELDRVFHRNPRKSSIEIIINLGINLAYFADTSYSPSRKHLFSHTLKIKYNKDNNLS